MTVDPAVIPGLLLLATELLALAAVGYIVARVALRQTDDRLALAQGLVIGPAMWGLVVNFILHLVPGRAGALAGWIVLLVLAAGLAWRAPKPILPRLRTATGLAAAASSVFLVMLAARQLQGIPDANIHLGLAALAQSGRWPLVFPWGPDQPFIYHYGLDLLVGLLAQPSGPNLAFTTELLSAYVWTGFALVLVTALLSRAGWVSLPVLAPLLLTAGAWTLLIGTRAPDILSVPILTGVPAAGLRASLASLYWPEVSLNWREAFEASPPNIWKPSFVMAYALTVIVLTCVAESRRRSWPAALTLAALVGFLGLLSEEIALVVLALWGGMEFLDALPRRKFASSLTRPLLVALPRASMSGHSGSASQDHRVAKPPVTLSVGSVGQRAYSCIRSKAVVRSACGPALAAILLAIGGGPISALLTGAVTSGASLGWLEDTASRHPLGTLLTTWPGGIGWLGLGVVPVAAIALSLAWKRRLVLAFVVGSAILLLASLTVRYAPSPHDVLRFDGHARNFALIALLLALAIRLSDLRGRWRFSAGALLLALLTWPTSAVPGRTLALGIGHGIELSNAWTDLDERESPLGVDPSFLKIGRHATRNPVSDPVGIYIRNHTPVDARIMSPEWDLVTANTGRPNASGFVQFAHLTAATGPEYEDAISYLEPAALGQLGATYIHAPDSWVARLPDRAQRWLDDPQLFEPLVRGETDALYRIRPEFLRLNPTPDPRSFEALRRTVPASAAVRVIGLTDVDSARIASTLAHTRLLGTFPRGDIHLLSEIASQLPGSAPLDFVIVARDRPSPLNLQAFPLVWWNRAAVAYDAKSPNAPAVNPPPQLDAQFTVRLSEIQQTSNRISFSATFTDQAPSAWTGQDWLVISGHDLPWALPTEANGVSVTSLVWFAGQAAPGVGVTAHVYEYDARLNELALQSDHGAFAAVHSSGDRLLPGLYILAIRLRHDHMQAAIIPAMRIEITEIGSAVYTLYPGEHGTQITPCPERLKDTRSCLRLRVES